MAVALRSSLQPWSPSQGQANELSPNSSRQHYLDSVSTTTVITPDKGNLADAQGKEVEIVPINMIKEDKERCLKSPKTQTVEWGLQKTTQDMKRENL